MQNIDDVFNLLANLLYCSYVYDVLWNIWISINYVTFIVSVDLQYTEGVPGNMMKQMKPYYLYILNETDNKIIKRKE